jgi:hypothetical protein
VDNGVLHALSNTAAGGNGVYLYGSGGFPSQTYLATNYWVDVVLAPASNTGMTPAVTSETPASGTTGVAVNAPLTATFNEPVQPGTISFTLTGPGNTAVPAALSYNSATDTATLTPLSNLAAGTTYTATVGGATDASGNVMSGPVSWTFTTSATYGPGPFTIWSAAATPQTADVGDGNSVELGVQFTSSISGTITGLNFYKGPLNTGTHVADLWSSSGQLLATATFTNETASGWQQVSFSQPVAVTAGTTYVASYHTDVGQYAADRGYFTSAYSSGPLQVPADGGVYGYGPAGTFPTGSFASSNYWVDVVFKSIVTGSVMGAGASLAAPAVRSQAVLGSPGAAASGAASGVAVIGAGAEGNGATHSIAMGTVDSGGADGALDWTARSKTARR